MPVPPAPLVWAEPLLLLVEFPPAPPAPPPPPAAQGEVAWQPVPPG